MLVSKLNKLIQLSDEKPDYKWINLYIQEFLSERSLKSVEELSTEDQSKLLDDLINHADDQELPDGLEDSSDGVKLITILPTTTLAQAMSTGTGITGMFTGKSEAELRDELEKSNKKLEVASSFLKELDDKVAKYESLGIDNLIATLEKYESLGSIEEIEQMAEIFEEKLESLTTLGEEGMSRKHEGAAEDDLLARYQALGSIEELEALVNGEEDMEEESECDSLTDKVESMRTQLREYREIGSTAEIMDLVDKYSSMKEKQESARIADDLGIPEEKVLETIQKMESVKDAEDLLVSLFPKTEGKTTKTNSFKEKTESATVVDADKTTQQPASRMTKLAQLCDKL